MAYLGEPNTSTGSLTQTLDSVLQANKTYTLKLSVGHRLDQSFTGYIATLQAGWLTLASSHNLTPAPGTFLEDVVVYRSGPLPFGLGQPLTISIQSIGAGQVDVDDVLLTVE